VLPQNEKSGVTFLGIGAELSSSTFVGNQLQLLLRSVTGPGDFILYATDSFGSPQVHMNSRDGLGSADVLTLTSASHLHLNWAFTKAGTYTIGLSASGTLHNQVITNSPTSHFTFHVVQPSAPILQILDRHETAITCRLLADPYVLCTLETTSDLTNWHSWTNISVQGGDTAIFNLKLGSPPSVQLIRSVIR
jgi:surface-anchored protein